jgi:hypothetical protein
MQARECARTIAGWKPLAPRPPTCLGPGPEALKRPLKATVAQPPGDLTATGDTCLEAGHGWP